MQEEPEVNVSKACRLCLVSTECADMTADDQENLLSFGIIVFDSPTLPNRICKNCHDILKFIQKFRKMCENSETYLREYCFKIETKQTSNTMELTQQSKKSQEIQMPIQERNSKQTEVLIPDEIESMESIQDHNEFQNIQAEEIAKEEQVEIEEEDTGEYLYEYAENENDPGATHITHIFEGTETEYENDEMLIEETCEQDDVSDGAIYIVDDSNSIDVGNAKLFNFQRFKNQKLLQPIKDAMTVIEGNHNHIKKDKQNSTDPHVCDICGNRYKRLGALETHRQRHLNQRPFECEICGVTFPYNFSLDRHMRKHTGDRPFTCEYCDRKFVDRSTMSRHQKIHRNERAYKCETCGKCFTYYSVLKTHIMSHTGEKPYCCGICDKGFHRASDLKNHLETLQHRKDPRAVQLMKNLLKNKVNTKKSDVDSMSA